MNPKELKLLHSKILELVEYFDSFCKTHNIIYYLMGGTALELYVIKVLFLGMMILMFSWIEKII